MDFINQMDFIILFSVSESETMCPHHPIMLWLMMYEFVKQKFNIGWASLGPDLFAVGSFHAFIIAGSSITHRLTL